MTDNFGSLRQAMSDLSEHGGSTDMYERSLRRSRRTQRRIAVTSAAAAAVVLAVGGTIAFSAAHRPGPSTPVATNPPPTGPVCPSAPALEGLVELPTGFSFVPGSVQCAQGWAAVGLKRPAAGDGVYLFHYKTGTGWRYYDEGTGWDCEDLRITGPAPFCVS
jgi:hypothetical protein